MINQLIEVPDYAPKEIKYILEVKWYVNDAPRGTTVHPIWFYNAYKGNRKQLTKIFSTFIFQTTMEDPLFCLKKIMKDSPDLKWKKFIVEKKEKHIVKKLPRLMESFYFTVKYWIIKEPIISYIEQSVGKSKELNELKLLFANKSNLSFEEYLEKKTKMLLELDLSEFEKDLKKPFKPTLNNSPQ